MSPSNQVGFTLLSYCTDACTQKLWSSTMQWDTKKMYIHKQIRTVKQDAHFSFQYNYCSWFWIKQEDHTFLTFLCHIVTSVCCLWGVQTSSLYLNGTLPRSPSECISSLALTRRPREVSRSMALCALTSVSDLFEFVLETRRHWNHLFWGKKASNFQSKFLHS